MSDDAGTDALARTPLFVEHRTLGATLVPFAGYAMPVRYPAGIMAEHAHTRSAAGLFDVSHMGQLRLTGDGAVARHLSASCRGISRASRPGPCATPSSPTRTAASSTT